jgi:cytochrome c6
MRSRENIMLKAKSHGRAAILAGLIFLALPSCLKAESDASKVFKANCVLCHSTDGSGDSSTGRALKSRDLRSPDVQKQSDEELAEIITKGKGKMPAFGAKLSADTIKSLTAHIREFKKK